MFCHGFPTYPLKVSILYINCLTWFYMSHHRMRLFLPWFQGFTSPRHILGHYDDDYMYIFLARHFKQSWLPTLGAFRLFRNMNRMNLDRLDVGAVGTIRTSLDKNLHLLVPTFDWLGLPHGMNVPNESRILVTVHLKNFQSLPKCVKFQTNIADLMVRARSANEMAKFPLFWWSFLYQAPSFSWLAGSKHRKCWTYLLIESIQMLLMKVLFRFGFISVCSIYCTQRLKERKRGSDESDAKTKRSCWAE